MAFSRVAALLHAALSDVTPTDHHAAGLADHDIAEHDDTTATGAELDTLTDSSNADALHAHVDNPAQALAGAILLQTNEDTYIPPDLLVNNPGIAKGACAIDVNGDLLSPSINVSSVTDTGAGDRTIVWDIDFATAVYIVVASLEADSDRAAVVNVASTLAGSSRLAIRNHDNGAGAHQAGVLTDQPTSCVAFGVQ